MAAPSPGNAPFRPETDGDPGIIRTIGIGVSIDQAFQPDVFGGQAFSLTFRKSQAESLTYGSSARRQTSIQPNRASGR
jgi:hypothetical protein